MNLSPKRIAHATQFLANAVRNAYRPPLVILGYHRVTALESDPFDLAISPDVFLEQMKWLSKNYKMVGSSNLGVDRKRRQVLITFDDGYADNVETALPILRSLKIPALLFVVTSAVGKKKEFFWDALSRSILENGKDRAQSLHYREEILSMNGNTAKMDALHHIWANIRQMSGPARTKAVSEVSKKLDVRSNARRSHRVINFLQLKEWASTPGMTVGGHTQTHFLLPGNSFQEQRQEISGCFEDLKRWGIESCCFAYPYGEYDSTSVQAVKDSGWRFAFTTRAGATRDSTSPWELPRLFVEAWSPKNFTKNVQRAFLRN